MGLFDKFTGKQNSANKKPASVAGGNNAAAQTEPASDGMNKNGTMFRISRPYGYHIPDVDQVIAKYNNVFTELKNTILSVKNENARLLNENKQIKSELRNMQMQMSMLQLPDTSEVQDHAMLDKMKQITGEKRYDFSDLDSEFESASTKKADESIEDLNKTLEETSADASNPIILDNDDAPKPSKQTIKFQMKSKTSDNKDSESDSLLDIID